VTSNGFISPNGPAGDAASGSVRKLHGLAKVRPLLMPICVVAGVVLLVGWAASHNRVHTPADVPYDVGDVVRTADAHLDKRWQAAKWNGESIAPAGPADDLQVLRRLSLALHGTVPSLEEIRQFEADDRPQRLRRWTVRMMNDKRFANYFAERLARGFVGTEGGTFVLYRRDRFTSWLRAELRRNRPYDEIVRQMIAAEGLWTGEPATNFMTATYNEKKFDVNKLAGRSVRAFLGQRIDCAQCHDHKLDDRWKQHHFQGLAAFFGQSQLSPFGVEDREADRDGEPIEYVVEDRMTLKQRTVKPAVPFHPEWLPEDGTRRERLAAWITHPENRRFERATINRVWALLFGRQYTYPVYAVDDLPDPDDPHERTDTKLLDILGSDFRSHGYDLRRLILTITSTKAFRMSSKHPADVPPESAAQEAELARRMEQLENNWAVFPLSRLRPEQVIGAMIQTNSVRTIDQNSNLFVRIFRALRESGFVKEYGDAGGDELVPKAGTIPQALLRMNGKLPNETLKATPFSASGRIPRFSGTDEHCIETAFLVVFSRRPKQVELRHWTTRLRDAAGKDARANVVEDLYWAMFNSPEFSWNH
jgi:Protein of unknown function (DUF1549)/Protein of unknown function (DUF1553)